MSSAYEVVSMLILQVSNQELYCIHKTKCCFSYRLSVPTVVSSVLVRAFVHILFSLMMAKMRRKCRRKKIYDNIIRKYD